MTTTYTCKVVVLPIEPIAFLPFLLPSPSLLLNLPRESVECSGEYVVMSFASLTRGGGGGGTPVNFGWGCAVKVHEP